MKKNGTELTVEVVGRLDSLTAPELEDSLEEAYDGIEKLILDLAKLEYISSAGLRSWKELTYAYYTKTSPYAESVTKKQGEYPYVLSAE